MSICKLAIDPLTHPEEIELAKTVESGVYAKHLLNSGSAVPTGLLEAVITLGEDARSTLYRANLRLASKLANAWSRKAGLPNNELLQEACIGLGEAIKRWDWAKGYRFNTFAWNTINGVLAQAAALRCGELDTSISAARKIWQARKVWNIRQAEADETISEGRFAREAKLGAYAHLVMSAGRHLELVPEMAENIVELKIEKPDLPPGWSSVLTQKENQIVRMHYGLGCKRRTRNYIAEQMQLSVSSVRRIELKALRKLRGYIQQAA